MSNKRLIYQDMFEDDELGMMPLEVRFLWVGLISAVADDQGRLIDNASLIKSKVFVYDSDVSESDIQKWLLVLQNAGMIVRYGAGNKRLIQIINWWEYQAPSWASESKYRAPKTWVDRVKVHTAGNQVKMLNWDKKGGLPTGVHTDVDSNEVKGECEGEGDDDCEGEVEAPATTPDMMKVYTEEINLLSPFIADTLKEYADEFTEVWVVDAIKEASASNGKSMKYIKAILDRWKREGKGSVKKQYQGKPTPESIDEQNDRATKEVLAEFTKGKFDAKGNRI